MEQWVRLCQVMDLPGEGEVTEVDVAGVPVCVAVLGGQVHALENACPHRGGPLGQGWVEGNAVICPWHAWAFDATTGICDEPESARVKVYKIRTEGDDVLADLA